MTSIAIWGVTDPGLSREHNEDAVFWDEAEQFAILADGMGGHNAGEVASAMVIETMSSIIREAAITDTEHLIQHAVIEANHQINEAAQKDSQLQGMGSTVVAVCFTPQHFVVAHVGDSRVYRLRDGELKQLTTDHSLVQEMMRGGLLTPEQALVSPHRNVITRAIGIEPTVAVDVAGFDTHCGDRVLLCSDGLTDMVGDAQILEMLLQIESQEAVCRELVSMANAEGGNDNISVIVADVR